MSSRNTIEADMMERIAAWLTKARNNYDESYYETPAEDALDGLIDELKAKAKRRREQGDGEAVEV